MIRAQEEVPTELQAIRSGVTMMVQITSDLLDLERLRMGAIVLSPVATLTSTLLQECAGQARTLVLAIAVSRCQFCVTSIISSFLACVLWQCFFACQPLSQVAASSPMPVLVDVAPGVPETVRGQRDGDTPRTSALGSCWSPCAPRRYT